MATTLSVTVAAAPTLLSVDFLSRAVVKPAAETVLQMVVLEDIFSGYLPASRYRLFKRWRQGQFHDELFLVQMGRYYCC